MRGTDRMHAASVAAALFVLYALSAPRTVAMEDDGMFVLSSYFLGIEHPPGYPLFTLIGHLFTYLPFGSVAYRVHLASAFFGALAAAALWLAARSLMLGRLPAHLAAFGLGISPVFWSQSIIAEVYTLNTFFFLVLVNLGLRVCPPGGQAAAGPERLRLLPWMALVFGLSLSNHYPLMLLVAPAFAILLWPVRRRVLERLGLLSALFMLGLVPYAWMVVRSWMGLPISFDGPLQTLPEIWFFISRAGYADVDHSLSAGWLDRVKFFTFLGEQLLVQFAVVGTLLAAAGFALQWRVWGRRAGAFLTVAFLMPSMVLLLLLGFDYSSVSKHTFHVYPLPAYAVLALWMSAGFGWVVERRALRRGLAVAAATALLGLIFAVGARQNLLADHGWMARYAQAVLRTLPPDAIVFGRGDPDLVPMAYLHMIENWRPDITLYHAHGLMLGNRLFHPLRTDEESARQKVREFIAHQSVPVTFTLDGPKGYGWRYRWLHLEIDKAAEPEKGTVDIPEEAARFFEEQLLDADDRNAWVAFFQGEMRRRYALLLARSLPGDRPPDRRTLRTLEKLEKDFHGTLGMIEGLMLNENGYSVAVVASLLEKVRGLTPSDVSKEYLTRFFYLRGTLRARQGDLPGAIRDFDTALSVWPSPENAAIQSLEDLYRQTGDDSASRALRDRVASFKRVRR